MGPLAGKGVLVVGTRRIGAVVVERLARERARVVAGYRRSRAQAEALPAEALVQGSLDDDADVARMVAEASAHLGRLDAVVSLASGYRRTPLDALDGAAWDAGLADARGQYLLVIAAARALRANPGPTRGHVVLFGDWAAMATPYRDYLPYLTAKAAVHFMVRAFAIELAADGILVNAVAPGPSQRPDDLGADEWRRDVLARTPLGRESSPDDIADMVAALLRTESITGEIVRVDAGRHLAGPGWGY